MTDSSPPKSAAAAYLREHAEVLDTLARLIFEENRAKGFWPSFHRPGFLWVGSMEMIDKENNKPIPGAVRHVMDPGRNIGEALDLIVSELSEALEAYRKKGLYGGSNILEGTSHFAEELGDTIIRLLDLAGGLGIQLAPPTADKLDYNCGRPNKHGKAL